MFPGFQPALLAAKLGAVGGWLLGSPFPVMDSVWRAFTREAFAPSGGEARFDRPRIPALCADPFASGLDP